MKREARSGKRCNKKPLSTPVDIAKFSINHQVLCVCVFFFVVVMFTGKCLVLLKENFRDVSSLTQ